MEARMTKMRISNYILKPLLIAVLFVLANSCTYQSEKNNPSSSNEISMKKEFNPVVYFEIPVTDIDRAIKFYTLVFHFNFEKEKIDNNEMALFPFVDENTGISGALAKGKVYKPTKDGVIIYFKTESIDKTLKLVTENGGQVLYTKTSNGDLGFVAEFEDSEGNRIALHEAVKQ
jgi:uncharacterized protein